MTEMSNISADIQKAIEENLPGMVGKELQLVLKKAEEDAANLKLTKQLLDDCRDELGQLQKLNHDEMVVRGREAAVFEREKKLDIREEILKLKESHATERVTEIRNLTERVFMSNRLGYNLNLGMPNPNYGKPVHPPQYPGQSVPIDYSQQTSLCGQMKPEGDNNV